MNCNLLIAPPSGGCNQILKSQFREPVGQAEQSDGDLDVRLYASFVRAIERAPIETKGHVFSLMARNAAVDVDAFRQNMVDGLWEVAVATGLVPLIGTSIVQGLLANAFGGGSR